MMSVEFETVQARREAALAANQEGFQRLQEEHDHALQTAFRNHFPRRRWDATKASQIPGLSDLRAPFLARAKSLGEARQGIEKAFQRRLQEASLAAPLPRTAELNLVDTASASRHHTQGLGASTYARSAALQKAAAAARQGLRAEVRPVGEPSRSRDGVTYQDYGVYADTTELGYTMLQHRPDPPLRDVLKTILQAGTNPRVFFPFLPWDAEEQLGLDARGNDLPGGPRLPPREAEVAEGEAAYDAPLPGGP